MSAPAVLSLLLAAVLLGGCDKGGTPPPGVPKPAASGAATMVTVPEGPFWMGSDEVDTAQRAKEFGSRRPWYEDEHPRRQVALAAFSIDSEKPIACTKC